MTKPEAITFLNTITPTTVSMVTIDAVKWADFKTTVLAILADNSSDPKWKAAVLAMDAIDNAAVKST
jgi:hypothetical protein